MNLGLLDLIRSMSIEEYIDRCYGDPGFVQQIFGQARAYQKTDDPVLSSTTGVLTTLYGEAVWSMIHRERNALAALPKVPWAQDGLRVSTADPAKKVEGMAETGTFPETVKPTWAPYKLDSKWEATTWDVFEKARQHTMRNEGINLDAELRREMMDIHLTGLDEYLLKCAETEAGAASDDRAAADMTNLESLDRLISSGAEEGVFGGSHNHWYDPYGTTIDRDAGTTYDSQVLHGGGTDRAISTALIDQLIRQCEDNGLKKEYSFFLTGRDTRDKIKSLMQAQLDYVPTQRVQFSVNGVQTDPGLNVGPTVVAYNDIPIITDKNTPKDTISRIFLIDTRYMRVRLMLPTMFLSTRGQSDWLQLDKIKTMNAFLTVAEVECPNFKPHGKLRDLL